MAMPHRLFPPYGRRAMRYICIIFREINFMFSGLFDYYSLLGSFGIPVALKVSSSLGDFFLLKK
jgi:hypothetical protein